MSTLTRIKAPMFIALSVFAAMLSLIALSPPAMADGTATYSASNGWKLTYAISDTVTITGVAEAGNGALTIPSKISGKDVTALADECFLDQTGLVELTLPETLTDMGRRCFEGSTIASFTLPSKAEYIPAYCFKKCSNLGKVTFKAPTLSYISANAFEGCISLESIQIPPLTGRVPYADKGNIAKDFPLGNYCFWNCTNLKSIEFLGSVGDDVEFFSAAPCLEGCDNLEAIVYHTKKSPIPNGMSSTDAVADKLYFSLDFYASEQNAENGTNRVGSVTYSWDVAIMDILLGRADASDSWMGLSRIPAAPSGKVWGIAGNAIKGPSTKLADSYKVVACDPNDLAYCYVSSPVIEEFLSTKPASTNMNSQSYPAYYFDGNTQTIGLDKIAAYSPTGAGLAPSTYRLAYKKGLYANSDWTWTDVELPLTETGTYKVCARGLGDAAIESEGVMFTLQYFSPQNTSYGGDAIKYLGSLGADAMSITDTKSLYSVVVPEDDWRYQLIGAGLAGVGHANILFDGKGKWDTETVRSFAQAGAASVQIVGSKAKVPESADPSAEAYLVDLLKERDLRYLTRYSDDSTIQALARSVYVAIRDQHAPGGADVWEAGWSNSAIIVPSTLDVDILPVARLAYSMGSPVFFTESDGTLDPKTLKYLISDDFEKVYIAGDTAHIPQTTLTQIETLALIETERILDASGTSGEVCAAFADLASSGADGGVSSVVIASTERDSNVIAASQLAALTKGALLTCSSEADSKVIQEKMQDWISENGYLSISRIYYVGDFSQVDSSITSRIASIWKSPMSTAESLGDTREIGDFVYRLSANGTATLVRVRSSAVESVNVSTVAFLGKGYSVTSVLSIGGPSIKSVSLSGNVSTVAPSAFGKATSLKTLNVASASASMLSGGAFKNISSLTALSLTSKTVKSLPANSFAGCSNLSTLSLNLSVLTKMSSNSFGGCAALKTVKINAPKLTALPSSVFKGASKLTSCTLTASKIKSIGSQAFYGCSSLKSMTIGKNVKTIGSKAFYGCKSITSVTIGSAVTSIGTYAFQNCAKLAKLTIPAKVKTIGSSAFKGAKKLKTLTVKSTKLTKKTVKKSLTGSSVTKVKVSASSKKATNKKYITKYKKYFTKANAGKKVSVK